MRPIAMTCLLFCAVTFATDAVAICASTGSRAGISCGYDGSAAGQLFSPSSKIVRQGTVLRLAEERRRERMQINQAVPSIDGQNALLDPEQSTQLASQFGYDVNLASVDVNSDMASGKEPFAPLGSLEAVGLFLSGSIGVEEQENTERETGVETDRYGIAGGIDFRSDVLLVGLAVDYLNEDLDYKHGVGAAGNREVGVQLYGAHDLGANAYVLLAARVARNEYNGSRSVELRLVNPPDPGFRTGEKHIKSRTDGYKYSFVGGAGYEVPLKYGLAIGLSGALEFERSEIEAYTEDDDEDAPTFHFDHQEITTLTSSLEVSLSKAFDLDAGTVIPWTYLRYYHEFEDDSRTVQARVTNAEDLASGSDTPEFRIVTNDPDRDYFSVGGGILANIDGGLSAFLSYDFLFGHSFREEQSGSAGIRMTF